MKLNRLVSTAIATGLLLGSTGLAFAASPQSNDNPFSIYREAHDPSNAGTAITVGNVVSSENSGPRVVAGPAAAAFSGVPSDNPFALYRRAHEPSNAGVAVKAVHRATPYDVAISQVSPDPFH